MTLDDAISAFTISTGFAILKHAEVVAGTALLLVDRNKLRPLCCTRFDDETDGKAYLCARADGHSGDCVHAVEAAHTCSGTRAEHDANAGLPCVGCALERDDMDGVRSALDQRSGRAARTPSYVTCMLNVHDWERRSLPNAIRAFDSLDLAEASYAERLAAIKVRQGSAMVPAFDARELGAVLAGLRSVQQQLAGDAPSLDEIDDVLTSGGTVEPLTAEEIDALCERLNFGSAEPRP